MADSSLLCCVESWGNACGAAVVGPKFFNGGNNQEITLLSTSGITAGCWNDCQTLAVLPSGSWEFNSVVCICFLDLEKAYDCDPQGILWVVVREYKVPETLKGYSVPV